MLDECAKTIMTVFTLEGFAGTLRLKSEAVYSLGEARMSGIYTMIQYYFPD